MGITIDSELLFETIVPLAKFTRISKITKKPTEQLCTLNNYSRWSKYGLKELKNQYKNLLREFFIPEPEFEPLNNIILDYQILRHNKRKVDVDNVIINQKWISDLLQDMNWISDDDQVTLVLRPSIFHKGISETQFKLKAHKT